MTASFAPASPAFNARGLSHSLPRQDCLYLPRKFALQITAYLARLFRVEIRWNRFNSAFDDYLIEYLRGTPLSLCPVGRSSAPRHWPQGMFNLPCSKYRAWFGATWRYLGIAVLHADQILCSLLGCLAKCAYTTCRIAWQVNLLGRAAFAGYSCLAKSPTSNDRTISQYHRGSPIRRSNKKPHATVCRGDNETGQPR